MDEKHIAHYLDMWKQTITVQQHFNDIEWRIRGLALTALTFALGAAAVAAKDRIVVNIFGSSWQLSSFVCVLGLFLWGAFYFVDRVWYHRLLIGSVRHGTELENALKEHLPLAGLTKRISENSVTEPVRIFGGHLKLIPALHSTTKLFLFYLIGAAVLFLTAVALQVGSA